MSNAMTKKHYELIASVIRNHYDESGWDVEQFAESMADALATTNEYFNRERFLKACGTVL